jgi:hypothetical protein
MPLLNFTVVKLYYFRNCLLLSFCFQVFFLPGKTEYTCIEMRESSIADICSPEWPHPSSGNTAWECVPTSVMILNWSVCQHVKGTYWIDKTEHTTIIMVQVNKWIETYNTSKQIKLIYDMARKHWHKEIERPLDIIMFLSERSYFTTCTSKLNVSSDLLLKFPHTIQSVAEGDCLLGWCAR